MIPGLGVGRCGSRPQSGSNVDQQLTETPKNRSRRVCNRSARRVGRVPGRCGSEILADIEPVIRPEKGREHFVHEFPFQGHPVEGVIVVVGRFGIGNGDALESGNSLL